MTDATCHISYELEHRSVAFTVVRPGAILRVDPPRWEPWDGEVVTEPTFRVLAPLSDDAHENAVHALAFLKQLALETP